MIIILGISGAMRCNEIFELKLENVIDKGSHIKVSVKDTKNYVDREFIIISSDRADYAGIIRKFTELRPSNRTDPRYLTAYNNGKCTNLAAGIHKVRSTPSIVAKYLGLNDPKMYTGHSCRRSSATMFADTEANIGQLKQLGGWKSSTVAESYVDQSAVAKMNAAHMLLSDKTAPGTSKSMEAQLPRPDDRDATVGEMVTKHVSVETANNCSFVINIIHNNNK